MINITRNIKKKHESMLLDIKKNIDECHGESNIYIKIMKLWDIVGPNAGGTAREINDNNMKTIISFYQK